MICGAEVGCRRECVRAMVVSRLRFTEIWNVYPSLPVSHRSGRSLPVGWLWTNWSWTSTTSRWSRL